MTEIKWQQLLYSEEEFFKLYKLSNSFEDNFNGDKPVRSEDETFTQFIDKGSKALSKDHEALLELLL